MQFFYRISVVYSTNLTTHFVKNNFLCWKQRKAKKGERSMTEWKEWIKFVSREEGLQIFEQSADWDLMWQWHKRNRLDKRNLEQCQKTPPTNCDSKSRTCLKIPRKVEKEVKQGRFQERWCTWKLQVKDQKVADNARPVEFAALDSCYQSKGVRVLIFQFDGRTRVDDYTGKFFFENIPADLIILAQKSWRMEQRKHNNDDVNQRSNSEAEPLYVFAERNGTFFAEYLARRSGSSFAMDTQQRTRHTIFLLTRVPAREIVPKSCLPSYQSIARITYNTGLFHGSLRIGNGPSLRTFRCCDT